MERLEIEVFLTLAEELHFGRVAERVGTSTARVSQLLGRLEQSLGVKLFERSSRRVELSPAGAILESELGPAWQQVLAAVDRVTRLSAGIEGSLVISSPSAEAAGHLQDRAKVFLAQYPDCDIRFRQTRTSDVRPWLRPGTVDAALIRLPNNFRGLTSSAPVLLEQRVVVVSRAHELGTRDVVDRRDLHGLEIVPADGTAVERVAAGSAAIVSGEWAHSVHEIVDIVAVPVRDADPIPWGFVWPTDVGNALRDAFVGYCERQR